ncbi:MAG TPA: hypothetical protein VFH51_09025, partial [Myxococcota bacterium]|nr:hypothetical protein [Myxococcota bacterium]
MPHGRSSLCLLVYACLGSAAACGRGAAPAGTTDTDVAPVPVLAAGSCLTRFPNAAGVGLGCSAKGNQCVGSPAPFCSADFTTLTEAFCTRPCAADADCGTDALCLGDPNGATTVRACVPAPCLDTLRETPGGGLGLPTDANGVAAQGCPPAKANAQGVGRACTKGGNQCVGTGAAYCTVDYTPTPQAFCTKPCGGTPE